MKRIFSILFLLIFIFVIKGFARGPIDECFDFLERQDYQKAIEVGKRAVILFPRSFEAHLCLGLAYRGIREFDLAIESFKKAELCVSEWDSGLKVIIYGQIAMTYKDKGDLDNALFYYQKAFAKEPTSEVKATILNNIAEIYREKGNLDKALSCYEKSLKLTDEEIKKAHIYNNIALIYERKGEYSKAIDYLIKATEIGENRRDYHSTGKWMLNLGNIYRRTKDFDKAYIYLQEGLKRMQEVRDKTWEAVAYKYLGWYYRDLGDEKLAKDYLTKAYDLFKSIGAETEALDTLSSLQELEKARK